MEYSSHPDLPCTQRHVCCANQISTSTTIGPAFCHAWHVMHTGMHLQDLITALVLLHCAAEQYNATTQQSLQQQEQRQQEDRSGRHKGQQHQQQQQQPFPDCK